MPGEDGLRRSLRGSSAWVEPYTTTSRRPGNISYLEIDGERWARMGTPSEGLPVTGRACQVKPGPLLGGDTKPPEGPLQNPTEHAPWDWAMPPGGEDHNGGAIASGAIGVRRRVARLERERP